MQDWPKITSRGNDKVKAMRALQSKKGRKETGLCLLEGAKIIEEAYKSALRFEMLALREDADESDWLLAEKIKEQGADVFIVTPEVMEAICDVNTPQAIAASVEMPQISEITYEKGIYLVLDALQDPGNVGTLIRSADAFAYVGVILGKGSADPYSPKCLRSSMGSVFHLPLYFLDDLAAELRKAKEQGLFCIATDLKGEESWPSEMPEKTALLIGNEAQGLSKELLELADWRFRLPMPGQAESLNAAVFSGIMMYALWERF